MSNTQELTLDNLFNVKGLVALVTGGGTGIGLMIAQALAVNGAKVYIVGRNKDRLDRAISTHAQGIKGEMLPLVADITSKAQIADLAKEVERREQKLHILVNNAGVAPTGEGPQGPNVSGGSEATVEGDNAKQLHQNLFGEGETFEMWEDVYRTNAISGYFTTMALLPLLEKASLETKHFSATIINITSISGITRDSQNHFSYNASKAAAIHVSNTIAKELAQRKIKIRVNSIAPGVYPSEMTAMSSDEATGKSSLPKEKFESLPAERPGNDRDMASAALFCATNQYLNGVTIPVDGGYLLAKY